MTHQFEWESVREGAGLVRVRRPKPMPVAPPIFVLLHGWTGNEFSMEPFLQALPDTAVALLFRAPFHAPKERGGFSWIGRRTYGGLPTAEMYGEALDFLRHWLKDILPSRYPFLSPHSAYHWMGFSQGGSVVIMQGLNAPEMTASLAVLSGFFPAGAEPLLARRPLAGKSAFVAHGTKDPILPFPLGERVRAALEEGGAQVRFCTAAVGHKVAARCMRALREFYSELCGATEQG